MAYSRTRRTYYKRGVSSYNKGRSRTRKSVKRSSWRKYPQKTEAVRKIV